MKENMDKLLDNITGCMVGGALGDAFGYTIEFDCWPEIKAKYGERGIRTFQT